MTDKKTINALKTELCDAIEAKMEEKKMNYYSFDVSRTTASTVRRHGDGNIQTLLSMVDNMGCKLAIVEKD